VTLATARHTDEPAAYHRIVVSVAGLIVLVGGIVYLVMWLSGRKDRSERIDN
jgi:hypothetical protein